MKSAYIIALIPFRIAVASPMKTDVALKLNTVAWINFLSQLRMIKSLDAPCVVWIHQILF